ncbi:uncharacterized protein BO66DRAFT_397335 [Aspergillus aculeatinus CBS 121060]|uniref:Uncharacterized protein n=1 Tax=Aspergillus aculeatinus CBS 121060 TaxID=1448322 RepID=A0ACD1HMP3_9EURO|nr:hypothetical protein BO66DRAFT_397335 [Aspergillus aculeatinus CBS 121060]RAH74716.1 hypothetical protein BO66DRAFT_397335 [Aspergillus aculeatinus CBS 121060]
MSSITSIDPSATSEVLGLDPHAILAFFARLKDLTPSDGFNMVQAVAIERNGLVNELTHWQKNVVDLEKVNHDKETTIRGMFETFSNEKQSHEHTQRQVKELEKTIEQLRAEASRLKDSLSTAKAQARALEEENSKLQRSMNDTRTRLITIEGFSAGHIEGDENSLIDGFTALWGFAKTELRPLLNIDLSTEAVSNDALWENLRRCELVQNHQIPIPCSNTLPAQHIRLATILALLAREIDKYIFQPCYIIPEETHIRQVLFELAVTDSAKESFCRSLLQSINTPDQKKNLSKMIQTVVKSVLSYLEGSVPETHLASMRTALERIVSRAADVWDPIRRAKRRYELDFDQPGVDETWLPFTVDEPKQPKPEMGRPLQEEPALTIFPRLSVIEKGTITTHTVVIQLSKSSSILREALSEISKTRQSSGLIRLKGRSLLSKSSSSSSPTQSNGQTIGARKAGGK